MNFHSPGQGRRRQGANSAVSRLRRLLPFRRSVPIIFQVETTECSLACLAMIMSHFGQRCTVAQLRRLYPVSLRGLTLRSVLEIASDLGLAGRAVRCEPRDLYKLSKPAMLHWDMEHFVVLVSASRRGVTVNDPGRGVRLVSWDEISDHFSGIAVTFSSQQDLPPLPEVGRLTFRQLVDGFRGARGIFTGIFLISFLLELTFLAQPLVLRSMVDWALASPGPDLSYLLGGFAALVGALAALLSYSRDHLAHKAGASLNQGMVDRLFRHGLSLPISYFEKRLVGDVTDRYRATEQIERFLIGDLPIALLDGVMALASITILIAIAPSLGLATLVIFLIYAGTRFAGIRQLRNLEEETVFARALESGYLSESLQNILTIKVRGSEAERQANWISLNDTLLDAQRRLNLLQARYRSLRTLLAGLDLAIFSVLAYFLFRAGALHVGLMFAILFYKSHFFIRSISFVERIIAFRMLSVHIERLEDIAFQKPERRGSAVRETTGDAPLATSSSAAAVVDRDPGDSPDGPVISFDDVSFQYGPADPFVVEQASFSIRKGELVALTGASGTGKTTILKLILGLYMPSGGEVRIGSSSTAELDLSALRRRFGVVMQEDQLLVGSIAENISFFDPDLDQERVEWCCRQAAIADDVAQLPMGFSTRLGGHSTGLSGGQRQRLLIARALYRGCDYLLLDEGTANLDPQTEREVLRNLSELGLTTLLIAHGEQPVRIATRVLLLENRLVRDCRLRSELDG